MLPWSKNKKGFTLIELLIVIAIIGVLSSLLMVNFIGVRQRARDAQRKTDLRQVQSALEMYRADVGRYITADDFNSVDTDCIGSNGSAFDCDEATATIYMQEIPGDPSSGTYCYWVNASSTKYYIVSCLENNSDGQAEDSIPSEAFDSCDPYFSDCESFFIVTSP